MMKLMMMLYEYVHFYQKDTIKISRVNSNLKVNLQRNGENEHFLKDLTQKENDKNQNISLCDSYIYIIYISNDFLSFVVFA